MSDDGKSKLPGHSKTVPFVQGTAVRAGDVVGTGTGGWHVVLQYHVLGSKPYPAGYSDDFVHYSVGAS